MKKITIMCLLLQVSISNAVASGCGADNYLGDEVKLDVGSTYLKSPKVEATKKGIKLTDDYGLEITFRHPLGQSLGLASEDIHDIKNAINSNNYKVVSLNNENVLFSFVNDCDGLTHSSTGRYKLKFSTPKKTYIFTYPVISDALDWREWSDKFFPLFKY